MPNEITDPVLRAEAAAYAAEFARHAAGEVDDTLFQRFRGVHGTHAQRQPGVYMIRIRTFSGTLTAAQLRKLADCAETYSQNKLIHITTRQAIQFHFIPEKNAPALVADIAESGLTVRETGGNDTRNVTSCAAAGVCAAEAFDYRPHAELLTNFFLRNPVSQNLPRKFKVGFSCGVHETIAWTNDLSFFAVEKDGQRGFRVLVGGGLGSRAYAGKVLHEFLPETDLLDCAQAVVTVFSRHGNRENLFRARLKYLIEELGLDGFQKLYETEFRQLREDTERQQSLPTPKLTPELTRGLTSDEKPPEQSSQTAEEFTPPPELKEWFAGNVQPQKNAGHYFVTARVPLGDVKPATLRAIADLAEKFGLEVRTTIRQDLALAHCAGKDLPAIHAALAELKLIGSLDCAASLVSCPGTTSCNLAITSSKGLGQELLEFFEKKRPDLGQVPNVNINISGCPNSCGLHRVADIGLQGAALVETDGVVPSYEILLGIKRANEKSTFGGVVAKVPAKNTIAAVAKILDQFVAEKEADESFIDFVEQQGVESFQKLLAPFTKFDSEISADDYRRDFGSTEPFELKLGRGECAGAAVSLVEAGLADALRAASFAEQQLKAGNHELAREQLLQSGEALIRGLLVSVGVDFFDRTKSSREFDQELIRSGKFSPEYGSYFAHIENASVEELPKRLTLLQSFIKDARFYVEALQQKNAATEAQAAKSEKGEKPTITKLDLKGVRCPINYVKVKLKLETLPAGSVLEVLLDPGEPQTNVPLSVRADGHEIVEEKAAGDLWKIVIKKKS